MEITEFKQSLAPRCAILCFDFGTKRLGTAVSDIGQSIATAQKTIFRTTFEKDMVQIKQLIAEKQIGGIIYGLPLLMNGTEGQTARLVKEFALKVFEKTNLPYMFWDERLSSVAMENFLIKEADLSRKSRKKILDSSSAAYILQGALDALKRIL